MIGHLAYVAMIWQHSWSTVLPIFPSFSKQSFLFILPEKNWYCPELHKINNGYCRCEDEQSNSLDQCQPYYRGIQVQCFCNSGYKLQGSALLTCTGLGPHDEGAWDHEVPYCLRGEFSFLYLDVSHCNIL